MPSRRRSAGTLPGGPGVRDLFRYPGKDPALDLYSREHSVRLTDSAQLVQLGIMTTDPDPAPPGVPSTRTRSTTILPVGASLALPLLSVAITCFTRLAYIERAICSVLTQLSSSAGVSWEIEVVQDGADPTVRSALQRLLERIGDPHVPPLSPRGGAGRPTGGLQPVPQPLARALGAHPS